MLIGRRYLLAFTPKQQVYAEQVGDICRAVWNTGLEQRREFRRRGGFISYVEQARQLAEAKRDPYCAWLADAPAQVLQQVLRDLDRRCKEYGTWKITWRSKVKSPPSFRFPAPELMAIQRLSRRWARVKLPKLGWVRFRWTRPLGGTIRNATVRRDAGRWYVSFCVEDGFAAAEQHGKPPIGVDRGVAVAVTTSDGWMRDRTFVTLGETKRLKRLRQKAARSRRLHGPNQPSKQRDVTRASFVRLHARIRSRRQDFAAWAANRLAKSYGLIVVEDLRVKNMTASSRGTVEQPGRNVRQKAGLNEAILSKGWGRLLSALHHKARYTGSQIVKVNPAYTSQRCSRCGHVDPKSRESQADFRCTACGYRDNADVNAAKNILAAGLAVTGRGDLAVGRSTKRQPLHSCAPYGRASEESALPVRQRGGSQFACMDASTCGGA